MLFKTPLTHEQSECVIEKRFFFRKKYLFCFKQLLGGYRLQK